MGQLNPSDIHYDDCGVRPSRRVFTLWESERKPRRFEVHRKSQGKSLRRYVEELENVSDEMAHLESLAKAGGVSTFVDAVNLVDWRTHSASDHIKAIDLSLRAGAHSEARELASRGAEIHPDDQELQKYARILAPPQITDRRPTTTIKPKANIEWLRANRSEYKGRWIALKSGELVGSADSRQELTKQVGETKGTGILITHI